MVSRTWYARYLTANSTGGEIWARYHELTKINSIFTSLIFDATAEIYMRRHLICFFWYYESVQINSNVIQNETSAGDL